MASNKKQTMSERLNTLRAGVLGANDGILTVVGVLFSVAVATSNRFTIFIAGLSDLLACAFSMASGEYASVSTQRDIEETSAIKEKGLLKTDFPGELNLVQAYYEKRGVTKDTAAEIAKDLMAKKPLETVLSIKYDVTENHYMNPWYAAFASLISASSGGILPLFAMTVSTESFKWPFTILAVCFSVALTGYLSARLGDGMVKLAIKRNVIIGIITMIIHYAVGRML